MLQQTLLKEIKINEKNELYLHTLDFVVSPIMRKSFGEYMLIAQFTSKFLVLIKTDSPSFHIIFYLNLTQGVDTSWKVKNCLRKAILLQRLHLNLNLYGDLVEAPEKSYIIHFDEKFSKINGSQTTCLLMILALSQNNMEVYKVYCDDVKSTKDNKCTACFASIPGPPTENVMKIEYHENDWHWQGIKWWWFH